MIYLVEFNDINGLSHGVASFDNKADAITYILEMGFDPLDVNTKYRPHVVTYKFVD